PPGRPRVASSGGLLSGRSGAADRESRLLPTPDPVWRATRPGSHSQTEWHASPGLPSDSSRHGWVDENESAREWDRAQLHAFHSRIAETVQSNSTSLKNRRVRRFTELIGGAVPVRQLHTPVPRDADPRGLHMLVDDDSGGCSSRRP